MGAMNLLCEDNGGSLERERIAGCCMFGDMVNADKRSEFRVTC